MNISYNFRRNRKINDRGKVMFGRKKKREPGSGVIEKTVSYMLAVPREIESVQNPMEILARLKTGSLFETEQAELQDGHIKVLIQYEGEEYQADIFAESYEIGPLFTVNHQLSEADHSVVAESDQGVAVVMTFGEDVLKSYHVQLKILDTIVPDMAGMIDFCTERVLSGVWVKLAAQSMIQPSPDYLYAVQAVSNGNGQVWLHTHGLNRCGAIEVEILDSDQENYQNHSSILQTLGKRIISDHTFIEEEDAFMVGRMNNGAYIVATWIAYEEALKLYPKDILGGIQDRKDGHNEATGVVYLYLSEKDFENKKYRHVSAINEYLSDNVLMMYSNEETLRMSALAKERLHYFSNAIKNEDTEGIMKIGLEVDEEYKQEEGFREHIWFHIKEINGSKAQAVLTQEPYYIKDLHEDAEMEVDLNDLTDWILLTPEGSVTPDSVYLLEKDSDSPA